MTGNRWREWLRAAWLPLPFLAIGLIGTAPAGANQPGTARQADTFAYALVAVAALSLALRRWPGICLAVNTLAVSAYLALGYPFGPILFTVPVALYAVARRRPLRRALGWSAPAVLVFLAGMLTKTSQEPGRFDGTNWVWATLAWVAVAGAAVAVGAAVRIRTESAAGVRAEMARRAASEERLRMAQELHDTIGHGLAVIAMQAGVAIHVLTRDPAKAREAMEAVRATSRESLENLRAELDALRSPDAPARRPAPGLADLDRLADRIRTGGVTVRVDRTPGLPTLSSTVDTAAYRILQEALTNVLRHSGAALVQITIGYADSALHLRVTDPGGTPAHPSATPDGTGTGIAGMRAQAAAVGGTLTAGPLSAGGFAVDAVLPAPDPALSTQDSEPVPSRGDVEAKP